MGGKVEDIKIEVTNCFRPCFFGGCLYPEALPDTLSLIMDENRSVVIHSFVDETICPAQEKSREYVQEDGIYFGKQVIECSGVDIVLVI